MHAEVMATVVLNLLHGFSLKVGWRQVSLMYSSQRLVALLALVDQPLSRAYAAGTLWPETTDARANANLRSSLWRVQRACGRLVISSSQRLHLAPEVVVDVQEAILAAYRTLDGSDECEDILNAETLSVLSADLLPDWYESDWVLVHREQYHQLRLHALESMCERFAAARRYGEAVEAGLAAIRAEPLRESAHQALVRVHLPEGNRLEAARQYRRCCCLLRSELGLEPSPAMEALFVNGMGRPIRHRNQLPPLAKYS
jgi:DNA-binding SARP family transcriptional activator